jgi:glucose/arabinose dehydrogenase
MNKKNTAYAATLALLATGIAFQHAGAQQDDVFATQEAAVQAETVASGLSNPWAIDFLPDGAAIVTERPGTMRLLVDGVLSDPIEGVPGVWAQRQGGLLDVAVSPDFADSGLIFFTFSEPGEGGAGSALARAVLERDGASASLSGVEVIFTMNRKTNAGQHFGSRIVFHPDGTVFVTTGDRGDGERSQDMHDHAGAVLRVNPDGSIPQDNPSPDGSAHLPEIWSKGHRNIQGAVFDPVTEALWVHEHGPRGGDELNRPEPGGNFGWPVVSLGVNYSGTPVGDGEQQAEGMIDPVHHWTPSIAPSGLATYQGDMFPEWQGDFLVGALAFELVTRLERDDEGNIVSEERMFEGEFGRIRDVAVAEDGAVWLVTDESDGRLIRLTRAED